MLYTVRPLERIYALPGTFDPVKKSTKQGVNTEASAEAEYKEIQLPNGRIVTRRDGENYIIERINSTDMKDYLNNEYVPGKNYREKQGNK